MKKILLPVILVGFIIGCTKRPSGNYYEAPAFLGMNAAVDVHDVELTCVLSSTNMVSSCGVYLYFSEEKSKWDGELNGDTVHTKITGLYRHTTYEYKFFITNDGLELTSGKGSFTTLYDGPEIKGPYVDEWGKDHGEGIEFGNTVWAPVNCGYNEILFPKGKYYQWGKKEGIGGIGVDVEQIPLDSMLVYANNDLHAWNSGTENEPVKTENDPCPQGWRVPTGKELDYLYSRNLVPDLGGGYWFQNENDYMYLSASGGYTGSNLNYDCRNEKAFYWSSNRKYSLYFHNSLIKMQECDTNNAFSVRCIQE